MPRIRKWPSTQKKQSVKRTIVRQGAIEESTATGVNRMKIYNNGRRRKRLDWTCRSNARWGQGVVGLRGILARETPDVGPGHSVVRPVSGRDQKFRTSVSAGESREIFFAPPLPRRALPGALTQSLERSSLPREPSVSPSEDHRQVLGNVHTTARPRRGIECNIATWYLLGDGVQLAE